jgi:fucose 4-O-acetylase-like acetyltransferase
MGFYWRKTEKETGQVVAFRSVNTFLMRTLISVAVIGSVFYLMAEERISIYALLGSNSYFVADYNIGLKLSITAIAVVWIAFFFMVILPAVNKKILLVSAIGRNSFSIFILHGFVIMLMQKHNVLSFGKVWPPLAILIGTLGILFLFGNSLTAKVFDVVFTGNWIDWLWRKIHFKERKSHHHSG